MSCLFRNLGVVPSFRLKLQSHHLLSTPTVSDHFLLQSFPPHQVRRPFVSVQCLELPLWTSTPPTPSTQVLLVETNPQTSTQRPEPSPDQSFRSFPSTLIPTFGSSRRPPITCSRGRFNHDSSSRRATVFDFFFCPVRFKSSGISLRLKPPPPWSVLRGPHSIPFLVGSWTSTQRSKVSLRGRASDRYGTRGRCRSVGTLPGTVTKPGRDNIYSLVPCLSTPVTRGLIHDPVNGSGSLNPWNRRHRPVPSSRDSVSCWWGHGCV